MRGIGIAGREAAKVSVILIGVREDPSIVLLELPPSRLDVPNDVKSLERIFGGEVNP